jgi:hypothetical protein
MRWALVFLVAFSAACRQQPSPVQPSPSPAPTGSASATLTILGKVTEPDTNDPVEGASVCWSESAEPRCAQTGADGTYVLVTERPHIPPTARGAKLAPGVHKNGFEPRQSLVPYDLGELMYWSPGLQRVVRIEAGRSFAGSVHPQEGSGAIEVEDDCESCKRIQISIHRSGTLTLRLTAERTLRLALPRYDDRSVDAPLPVTAGEDLVVLVTGAVLPTRFELSTTFTPEM